jgi:hypothetical protein
MLRQDDRAIACLRRAVAKSPALSKRQRGAIGPIMHGEIKKAGQSAALGLEYDLCIMGHWHQELWLPRALVCNTLKGFDEYARNQLGAKPTWPS